MQATSHNDFIAFCKGSSDRLGAPASRRREPSAIARDQLGLGWRDAGAPSVAGYLFFGLLVALTSVAASGQVVLSPAAAPTNHTPTLAITGNSKPTTNQALSASQLERSETIRTACIQGRRRICGR